MTPHVMKRDGCKVPFKSERIKEAILRAAKAPENETKKPENAFPNFCG
ncbi:ATP cone domain-containing protein [Escherichia coli]|nr:ATP cone domain-containing protein [Escherichia coli]MDO2494987.1 ATP cone domain-containing protein [Escherichia coli]UJY17422.1 hypothetical protein K3591_03115 [Escherichia coli]